MHDGKGLKKGLAVVCEICNVTSNFYRILKLMYIKSREHRSKIVDSYTKHTHKLLVIYIDIYIKDFYRFFLY